MTKKDYIEISIALSSSFEELDLSIDEKNRILSNFNQVLMADNLRFDPEKFRDACGV